jgi:hypothetical protein
MANMVKVHRVGKPNETRFFTKEAWDFIKTGSKWTESEDQSQPVEEKKRAAAPVASAQEQEDKKAKLREDYNERTGKVADPIWNEARLFIEIEKAKKANAVKVEAPEVPAEAEPVVKEKRKYTKKQPA